MLGKTHVVLGIIASSWMISTNDIKTGLVVVGASIVGSLMPDIDHGESTLRRIITFRAKFYEEVIGIAVAAGFIYELFKSPFDGMSIAAIAIIAAAAVYTIIKNEHRGFSHSLAAVCLYGFGMFFLLYPAFLPFIIGYIVHLAADILTNSGIQILYPYKKRICFGLFNTNSIVEKIIYWVGMASIVIIAYNIITKIVKSYYIR